MKKKLLLLGAIFFAAIMMPQTAFAQDDEIAEQTINVSLGQIALLAIPPVEVNLSLSSATFAGQAVATSLSNENSRLRITSLVGTGVTRKVEAQISTGTLPVGTLLQIEALPAIQNFIGDGGASSGVQTLTSAAAVVVLNTIGSCNSGVEAGDGYVLKYTFGEDADLGTNAIAGAADITVTYTLVEEV